LPPWATNPVTGRRKFTPMSEAQAIALGRESDAQSEAEISVCEDAALQQHVSVLGTRSGT
jgi:hypothetical protein